MLNGGLVRVAAVIIAAVLSLTAAGCGSATSRPDTQVPSPSPGRDLLLLRRLRYWGFDHAVHHGELVVNSSSAASLTQAFRQLFAARFPIRQMRCWPRRTSCPPTPTWSTPWRCSRMRPH